MERYHPMAMGPEVHTWTYDRISDFLDTNPLDIKNAESTLRKRGFPLRPYQPFTHFLGFQADVKNSKQEIGVFFMEGKQNGGVTSIFSSQGDPNIRIKNFLDNYLHGKSLCGDGIGLHSPFYVLTDQTTESMVRKQLNFPGFVILLDR